MNITINEIDKLKLYDQISNVKKSLVYSGILHAYVNTNIETLLNGMNILHPVLNHIIYEYVHDFLLISYTVQKKNNTLELRFILINAMVNNISVNFDYIIQIDSSVRIISTNNEYNNKFICNESLLTPYNYHYDTISFFNYFMKIRYGVNEYINNQTTEHINYSYRDNVITSTYLFFPFLDARRTILNETLFVYVIVIMKHLVDLF